MMMTGILFAAFIAVNAEVPIGTNGVSDTARFVKKLRGGIPRRVEI